MERHTSFRVGGPARLMVLPRTEGQARQALSLASARGISPFFLGNGTNLLVSDRGYPGLVVLHGLIFPQLQLWGAGVEILKQGRKHVHVILRVWCGCIHCHCIIAESGGN